MEHFPEFVANHLYLFSLLIAILTLLIWNLYGDTVSGIRQVVPMEATRLINHENAVVIDLRKQEEFESGKYDAIVCNYANADMVGHSGDFQATIKAIEAVDKCLGKVIDSTTKVGGEIIITADHGNAEQLRSYDTEKIKSHSHTAHTRNPVPAIYIGRDAKFRPDGGSLSDIVPTMLYLMGLDIPKEMTGKTLLTLNDESSPAIAAKEI